MCEYLDFCTTGKVNDPVPGVRFCRAALSIVTMAGEMPR
jgi:hypothetical protein